MKIRMDRAFSEYDNQFKSFDPFSQLTPSNITPLDQNEERDLSTFVLDNPNGYPIPATIPGNKMTAFNIKFSWNAFLKYLKSRRFRNNFKTSLAFTIASLFTFITPLTRFFGDSIIFVPITLIYADMKFTVGGLINCFFFINVFLFANCVCSALGTYITQNKPFFLSIYIFFYSFIVSIIYGKYPRLYGAYFIGAMLFYNSIMYSYEQNNFESEYLLKSYFGFVIGGFIFFLMGIIVYPYRAFGILRKQIANSLDNIGYLLTLVLTNLIKNPNEALTVEAKESIRTQIMAVRFNFTVLLGLLKECRLEFDYNYFHYKDYKHLIDTLTDLLGHLSSMASCIRIKSAKHEPHPDTDQHVNYNDTLSGDYFNTQDTISGFKEMLSLTNNLKKIRIAQTIEQERSYIHEIKDQIEEILKESCSILIKLSYIFNQDPNQRNEEEDESLFTDIGANWEEIQAIQKRMVTNLFANNEIFNNGQLHQDLANGSFNDLADIETSNFLMNFLFIFSLSRFVELLYDFQKQVKKLRKKGKLFHIPKWKKKKSKNLAPANSKDTLNDIKTMNHAESGNFSSTHSIFEKSEAFYYSVSEYILRKIWEFGQLFKNEIVRFGLKVGIMIVLFTLLAFFDSTRNWYYDWHGQWTVITVFAVAAPTYAGEFVNCIFRSIGTLLGGLIAVLSWEISKGNPYVLCIIGFVLSFIMNHLKDHPIDSAKLGCVTATTFVIVLYGQYGTKLLEPENIENIWLVGVKRVTMVLLGIFIALIIGRILWPTLARIELRYSLATAMNYLGILYNQIMNNLMIHTSKSQNNNLKMVIKIERNIQLLLIRQRVLLSMARKEPRLRGPFEPNKFLSMIRSSQFILDLLRSTRVFVENFKNYKIPDPSYLYYTWDDTDCQDLITNIALCFYLYSAAIQMRKPLPCYLPNPENPNQRLNRKILIKLKTETDTDLYEFWIGYYAFSMCISEILSGLKLIEISILSLYGQEILNYN
ncbi:hypothetical protein BCR32DRAFT_293874 [Anaeromyces robustus]|uniref:Integral membrane bound transporter domain-containing protein n=1 Tax=Anaeromyces robustus TaxID=1754192 RepID=A0A1Y1X3N9_9FUNG|nr:hypothetical protein BCR32DRAFT_293874 [Anaeromyces robustus]|eukprot:ORX80429.1 hypothetical protein BCR32DRAFT_293874 [Anaeromyces robustus]